MFAAAIAGAVKIEDAEDILQNVYSAFYRRTLSKGYPAGDEAVYLLRTALKHELYRSYRQNKRAPVYIDDYENADLLSCEAALEEDISDRVADSISAGRVWEEVKRKGDMTARIFILRFRLELSLREIAEVMGISEATVTNRLYRTVRELKVIFNEYDI